MREPSSKYSPIPEFQFGPLQNGIFCAQLHLTHLRQPRALPDSYLA
jgi:hypothetical protein